MKAIIVTALAVLLLSCASAQPSSVYTKPGGVFHLDTIGTAVITLAPAKFRIDTVQCDWVLYRAPNGMTMWTAATCYIIGFLSPSSWVDTRPRFWVKSDGTRLDPASVVLYRTRGSTLLMTTPEHLTITGGNLD